MIGDWGLGLGVWVLGFGVWGWGFGAWVRGWGVWGLGFGVCGEQGSMMVYWGTGGGGIRASDVLVEQEHPTALWIHIRNPQP